MNNLSNKKFDSNIKRFVEKPDIFTAKKIYNKERFLWNSGLILLKAQDLIDLFLYFKIVLFKV